ncbi:MAG: hypothetical protein ACRBB5_08400 [Nitrosopumilus sp.]
MQEFPCANAVPGDHIVADGNGSLLRITPTGEVSTIVDSGLGQSFGVAIDSVGDYIVVHGERRLLKITPEGQYQKLLVEWQIPLKTLLSFHLFQFQLNLFVMT